MPRWKRRKIFCVRMACFQNINAFHCLPWGYGRKRDARTPCKWPDSSEIYCGLQIASN